MSEAPVSCQPDRWDEIDQAFRELLDRPDEEREGHLARLDVDDDVRSQLSSLLRRDRDPHWLLDSGVSRPGLPPIETDADSPDQALPTHIGRYPVVGELGRGGMGVVYLAEDPDLGRRLAIKVLTSSRVDPWSMRLFEREARTLAVLNHPAIATIYSLEWAEDRPFLTMEVVSGEPLQRLMRGLPMQLSRTLSIGHALAQALEAAHDAGVVHRDLKPQNVMVTPDDRLKVLDFGLAKAQPLPASAGDHASSGGTMTTIRHFGTPGYMSPEQIRGEIVDHRTDIWSFGCILYECLTGAPAFPGAEPAARNDAALRRDPEWSALPAETPDRIADLLRRCLAREAEGRDTVMSGVRETIGYVLQSRSSDSGSSTPTTARSGPVSLAVTPFVDLSPARDHQYLGDGIAEELINTLGHVTGMRVIARSSSFAFRDRAMDAQAIGRRLSVDHVLEGSVQTAGEHLRLRAQLITTNDGCQIWSETFDREMGDVFAVQDEIADAIVKCLKMTLFGEDTPSHPRNVGQNLEAYTLYLKGLHIFSRINMLDIERAIDYFQRSLALAPDNVHALASLANSCLYAASWFGMTRHVHMARRAALRAVELDPASAEAQKSLGWLRLWADWDWEDADRRLHRALEINPNYAAACNILAGFYLAMGQMRDAERYQERAASLDELSTRINVSKGAFLLRTHRYGEARHQLESARELLPDNPTALWLLGTATVLDGDLELSLDLFSQALQLSNRSPMILAALAWALGISGRLADAESILLELEERRRTDQVPSILFAKVHTGLGNREAALDHLDRAYAEHDVVLSGILTDEAFVSLRTEPRFRGLLRRMGIYRRRRLWDWPGLEVLLEPTSG